jgi:hypothetical protein
MDHGVSSLDARRFSVVAVGVTAKAFRLPAAITQSSKARRRNGGL